MMRLVRRVKCRGGTTWSMDGGGGVSWAVFLERMMVEAIKD